MKFGALPQMVLLPNPLLAVPLTPNDNYKHKLSDEYNVFKNRLVPGSWTTGLMLG